jgi:hypothetical protein
MVLLELLRVVAAVAAVAGNFRLDNQTAILLVPTALLSAEMAKVEAVVTGQVAAVAAVANWAVLVVDCLVGTTAAILGKMVIVWRPEVGLYPVAQQVLADLLTQLGLQEA